MGRHATLTRVLSVTYALMPLTPAACGGTEQIAAALLARHSRPPYSARLEVTTVAPAPSRIPGRLIATNAAYWRHRPATTSDGLQQRLAAAHDAAALSECARGGYHVVHIQGASLYRHARDITTPVLLTLHLPLGFYPPGFLALMPANLWLQAVSRTQCAALRQNLRGPSRRQLIGYINNGVDLVRYHPGSAAAADYFLFLGRICPEKAPHLAIELARRLGRPLVIAGAVYPFPAHQEYFQRQIAPHLGGAVKWLPRLTQAEKIAWLQTAAAVIIPSQVEETSSLVAMEAAACGRPVLAWRSGALPEIVRQGVTGWLGNGLDELSAAALRLRQIAPAPCRRHARSHFDSRRMAAEYFRLYQKLAA